MEKIWQDCSRDCVDPTLSRPEALLASAFGYEVNITYVGFTRAIRELHLGVFAPLRETLLF